MMTRGAWWAFRPKRAAVATGNRVSYFEVGIWFDALFRRSQILLKKDLTRSQSFIESRGPNTMLYCKSVQF